MKIMKKITVILSLICIASVALADNNNLIGKALVCTDAIGADYVIGVGHELTRKGQLVLINIKVDSHNRPYITSGYANPKSCKLIEDSGFERHKAYMTR